MATSSTSHPVSKRSLYFMDFVGEKNQTLAPIHGYDDKPIVPLENAIGPLRSYVSDVEKMVAHAKAGITKALNNLSIDGIGSIRLYTLEWEPREKSFFYILNQTLRAEERDLVKPWFLYLKLIMTALRSLPSISGEVYRGVKGDLRNQYSIGTIVTWWGFSSCTSRKAIIEGDQFLGTKGKRTMFVIKCRNGKDIHDISFYRNEFEVILLPATQLRVLECNTSLDLTTIKLEELQCEPEYSTVVDEPFPDGDDIGDSDGMIEKVIKETDFRGSVALNFGTLSDSDMWIVADQALKKKQCVELSLSKNRDISSHGISIIALALKTNTTLQTFSLTHNSKFSNESATILARELQNNRCLRVLDLSYNAIEDNGAEQLAEMLKVNKTLCELYLTKNRIHNQGAQQLASALKQSNTTLERLSLDYNPIGDGCIDSLSQMLKCNRTLKQLQILHTITLSPEAQTSLREIGKERVR